MGLVLTCDRLAVYLASSDVLCLGKLDTFVQLPIANRSSSHFKAMVVSCCRRAAIITSSLSAFRRFANSLRRTGSEAVGEISMGANKAVRAPRQKLAHGWVGCLPVARDLTGTQFVPQ